MWHTPAPHLPGRPRIPPPLSFPGDPSGQPPRPGLKKQLRPWLATSVPGKLLEAMAALPHAPLSRPSYPGNNKGYVRQGNCCLVLTENLGEMMSLEGGLKGSSFHLLPRESTVCSRIKADTTESISESPPSLHSSDPRRAPSRNSRHPQEQRKEAAEGEGAQDTKPSLKSLTKRHVLKSRCRLQKKPNIFILCILWLLVHTHTHTALTEFLRGIQRDH